MNEWTAAKERYLSEILSVSYDPAFFAEHFPEGDFRDILFTACGPACEVDSIASVKPGYFDGKKVRLTDFSTKYLPDAELIAQQLLGDYEVSKMDMTSLDLPDSSLDLCVCVNGLLYEKLIPAALVEAGRVLREGGIYFANTYPPYEDMDGPNFVDLPGFSAFEARVGLRYEPPLTECENAYFRMQEGSEFGADQVLITDENMRSLIAEAGFSVASSDRFSVNLNDVSAVRRFPLDKLVNGGYNYQTSVWVLEKGGKNGKNKV